MKKRNYFISIIAVTLVFAMALGIGCKMSRTKRLETINALYLDIKTIVTDPNVRPLIPPDKMADLAALERIYLEAVMNLEASKAPDDKIDLTTIVDCGSALLGIIDEIALDGKYARQLEAVQLGIKVLKNHLT